MDFTPEKISELRELAKKATPRPWKYSEKYGTIEVFSGTIAITWDKTEEDFKNAISNGLYIEAAANTLPSALDEIERLTNELHKANVKGD